MDFEKISWEINESIKRATGINAVFGEAVRQGNKIIIPVAKVKLRSCGGGGHGHKTSPEQTCKQDSGLSLGFGLSVNSKPIGFIEIKDDKTRFVHIIDKAGFLLAGLSILALSIWAFGKSPRPRVFI